MDLPSYPRFWNYRRSAAVALAYIAVTAGCTAMAQVTNFSDESCRTSFARQLSAILMAEGESPEAADTVATQAVSALSTYDLGPRPFAIAAPSGTDYRFFVQRKGSACVLNLYGRQKGFLSYTNNLTYIATQPLPDCTCAE
jgi:hypothetical protein